MKQENKLEKIKSDKIKLLIIIKNRRAASERANEQTYQVLPLLRELLEPIPWQA